MANILTDVAHTGGYLVSEAESMYRSREQVTVVAGAATLLPGTILGKLTADGTYVPYDPAAATGAQTISGILYEAATGTVERTITARDAEVSGAHLIYQDGADDAAKATANAALAGLGIIVR